MHTACLMRYSRYSSFGGSGFMDNDIYTEGKAKVYKTGMSFLNPNARASRDISVAFVKALGVGKTALLDATAATGIRGIRYHLEAGIDDVSFLEINDRAYADLARNLAMNSIRGECAINTSIQKFANTTERNFGIIDLDPFGGISPYIYDLMKVIGQGSSYIMATATDTAVLCGAESKACLRLYDAMPLHNELCHETGMRIMIGYMARIAAQFNLGIRVHMALSYMHYMRAFIELKRGNGAAMSTVSSLGYVGYCNSCKAVYCDSGNVPKTRDCKACGSRLQIGGKLWTGSLSNKSLIGDVVANLSDQEAETKTVNFAALIRDEIDIPFHYSLPAMTRKMHIGSVSMKSVIDTIEKEGYKVSRTQFDKDSIKTNAEIDCVLSAIKKAQ